MAWNLEALVVGAGPVGLFSALSLLERGVSVQVIDSGGPPLMRGYACALHPATLDRLDRLGLLPEIADQAHCVDRLAIRRPMGAVHWVPLDRRDGGYCCLLTLQQGPLEEILEHALEQRGVRVARLEEVTRVCPRDGFVRVTTARAGRSSEPVSAARGVPGETVWDSAYVIGADGHNSFCRRALGIEMVELRPTRVFGIFDFAAELGGYERQASVCFGPDGAAAFWPLGKNLGRWTFELRDGFADPPSLDLLQSLVRERAPWFSSRPEQLCWGEVVEFEERLVRRWGNGRVWLAGDAAHCTTPIGFQSMNQGFRESDALSVLVSGALSGEGRLGAFARFDNAQRAEWRHLVGVSADPMAPQHDPILAQLRCASPGPRPGAQPVQSGTSLAPTTMSASPLLARSRCDDPLGDNPMTPHATLARLSRHHLITITHDMRVSEALAVARAHRVHHLPVTHADTLVGILCSCDLHAAQPDTLVDEIMRRPVVALDHDASLLDAVSTMNAHYVGSVVLMDGNRACAVVTRADVVFARPDLASQFVEGQRDCCGHARHLSASADGYSLCMHCLDPGADGRIAQLAADDAQRADIRARSPSTGGSVAAGAAVASSTPPQATITIS